MTDQEEITMEHTIETTTTDAHGDVRASINYMKAMANGRLAICAHRLPECRR